MNIVEDMQRADTYEIKFLLQPQLVPIYEMVLENIASAVLTVMIEHGKNKGLWEVQAIFENEPNELDVTNAMKQAAEISNTPEIKVNIVKMPAKNWLAECYQSFQPITIGKYCIYGSHITDTLPDDKITLKIDAATAFGTGEHQTTHGCLEALTHLKITPQKVLDVGCGSGILAMAYAKTYQKSVDAVDIDEESVRVATENAKENNLSHLIRVWQSCGYEKVTEKYDLILCNILARPLMDMALDLKNHLTVGGQAILSGFLNRQERWVLKSHTDIGLKLVEKYRINGWSTLVVSKEEE
ncbi:MAG: 50S ribosomal protein L11 methyltransferase [Alphaproteobacteria bacterium]|nr:50S ribosomal protein L11 methyltransferase [Alphaproteobacteria bacterium]